MSGLSAISAPVDKQQTKNWIRAARNGTRQALGNLMVACHKYLDSIAGQSLRGKLGPSDSVHATALETYRAFCQIGGARVNELLPWLRRVLLHNATSANRQFPQTKNRKVSRESAWDIAQISERAADDTPSARSSLVSLKEQQLIEQSLARLPDDMRQAIVLRNKQHLTFAEIGVQLQRSDEAARKLWARGIERLQQILSSRDERT